MMLSMHWYQEGVASVLALHHLRLLRCLVVQECTESKNAHEILTKDVLCCIPGA